MSLEQERAVKLASASFVRVYSCQCRKQEDLLTRAKIDPVVFEELGVVQGRNNEDLRRLIRSDKKISALKEFRNWPISCVLCIS